MKWVFYVFLLLFFLPLHYNAMGQTPEFQHYETNAGLNNNTVYSIIQDKKGFIWIGTKDGVNKFDGIRFISIPIINNASITNNINTSVYLFQDSDEHIWLGTENGLFLYDRKKECFQLFSTYLSEPVTSIVEDNRAKELYLSCNNRLYKINKQKNSITWIDTNNFVNALSIVAENKLWFANNHGEIICYDIENSSYKSYNVFAHSGAVVSYGIEKTYLLNEDTLLIGTSNQGAKSFNMRTKEYTDFLTKNPDGGDLYVRDFLRVNETELWIATERGIFNYNLQNKKYQRYIKELNNPYSLSDNSIYCLHKDTEGGIWIGSYFGGVNYFPKRYSYFQKYFDLQTAHSLKGNIVREIVEDKNKAIWIGTEDNGLNKLNVYSNTFTHFKPNNGQYSVSSTNIHGLLSHDNELWVGTFDHGLDILEINTGKLLRHYNYSNDTFGLKSNFIHSMVKNEEGKIFLGTSNGLYYYNRTKNNFIRVNNTLFNVFYSALLKDNDNNIWAGTFTRGLYVIENKTNIVKKIELMNERKVDILLSKKITDIFQDSNNKIWIGTESGLFKYDINTKQFKEFATSNGLPSNLIYSMEEDNSGVLWISTSNGLASLSLKNNLIKIYDNNSGILFNQFNYKSSFKDREGYLYFGGIKGLIKFKTENFIKDTFHPALYITSVQLANGQNISLNNTNQISLKHNQASFNINFAALEYTAPKSIQYTYVLQNADEHWDTLSTNRKIYYNNLAHGTYTFKVKSTNAIGEWMDNQQELKIIITAPFYKSQLAYLLYIISFITISFLIIHFYRERNKEKIKQKNAIKKIEDEKEMYEAKIDFFTQVAHEIRTPLTLIKGPLEKIIKSEELPIKLEKNVRIMERNTNRLLDLANDLLNFRESETSRYSHNFKPVNFTKLIEEIVLRFQSAIDQKGIHLQIVKDTQEIIALADEEAITKIISNLLNNALKYSEQKINIYLSLTHEHKEISLIINNDGKTIPEEWSNKIFEPFFRYRNTKEPGTGIGLALAKSLTELHGGILKYENAHNNINSFILLIPYKK